MCHVSDVSRIRMRLAPGGARWFAHPPDGLRPVLPLRTRRDAPRDALISRRDDAIVVAEGIVTEQVSNAVARRPSDPSGTRRRLDFVEFRSRLMRLVDSLLALRPCSPTDGPWPLDWDEEHPCVKEREVTRHLSEVRAEYCAYTRSEPGATYRLGARIVATPWWRVL